MQTFLPFPDFWKSAQALDKRRCWKQVIEAAQLIDTITGRQQGWKHHPAAKMWKGYENALTAYYNTFWQYSVNIHKIKAVKMQPIPFSLCGTALMPPWFGRQDFHQSHINNLARKAMEGQILGRPQLYEALIVVGIVPEVQDITAPYVWPV